MIFVKKYDWVVFFIPNTFLHVLSSFEARNTIKPIFYSKMLNSFWISNILTYHKYLSIFKHTFQIQLVKMVKCNIYNCFQILYKIIFIMLPEAWLVEKLTKCKEPVIPQRFQARGTFLWDFGSLIVLIFLPSYLYLQPL